jgi:hypothetical protein
VEEDEKDEDDRRGMDDGAESVLRAGASCRLRFFGSFFISFFISFPFLQPALLMLLLLLLLLRVPCVCEVTDCLTLEIGLSSVSSAQVSRAVNLPALAATFIRTSRACPALASHVAILRAVGSVPC